MSTTDDDKVSRMADVLEAMFVLARSDDPVTAQKLADDIEGGDLVDVITEAADALVSSGKLCRYGDTGAITYDLADGIYDDIIRIGVMAIAREVAISRKPNEVAPPAGPNPDLYAKLAVPKATREEGRSAMEAFLADVHAARVKRGIPNVLIAPVVFVRDDAGPEMMMACFYGDQRRSVLVAAQVLRHFKADLDRMIAAAAGLVEEEVGADVR